MFYQYRLHFNAYCEDNPCSFQLLCTVKQNNADYMKIEKQLNSVISNYKGQHFADWIKEPTLEYIGDFLFDRINDKISGELMELQIFNNPTQIIKICR